MEKSVIVLASTLCFLSLLGSAFCETKLFVEGKIYCDTCRTQFVTRVSEYIKGAKVRLECREREGGSITYSKEAETDEKGGYRIAVEGEHEEEICEIVLVKSPNPDCAEIHREANHDMNARVSLTSHNGISTPVREANPLGFLKKERLPICTEVLRELGITSEGIV
ncbi:olee1-like protein [Ziziphus jujuba]|uniref:Olee1-like protein n=2 Tax=Ziziphus jujuba TaxID=326968 RepID=A0A6P3ZH48_ZIZJJ|nr:olee1-like protein [Ziziphus jujuba]KAH7544970.1 hypothetical protein FEM48_Zijuj01G0042600 [Ziziphus jujuba var. spinosa]